MSTHTFQFIADQAHDGIVFTLGADSKNPMAPGNQAAWQSPSYAMTDANVTTELKENGGNWVGTVHMLPGGAFHISATYFPVKGAADNIQLAGPIMSSQSESAIAVVGGGGKFAGARGQARCVVAMSEKNLPLYRYDISVEV